jgi:transposase
MPGKIGMRRYPVATKLEAIRMFYEEKRSYSEITSLLEIRDHDLVKKWLKQYRQEGESAFTKPVGRPQSDPSSEKYELEQLRMENALLKKLQSESQRDMLAKRDTGRSCTIRKSTK